MKKTLLIFCALTYSIKFVSAQVFFVSSTNHTIYGTSHANDFLVPMGPAGPLEADDDTCDVSPQPFTPGLLGNDLAFFCDAFSREKKYSIPQSVTSAQAFSYAKINGDISSTLSLAWNLEARTYTNSLDGYFASATNETSFNVNFQVQGIPDGTPVTVYYKYSIFGAGLTEHEDVGEDPVLVINSFSLNGNDETGTDFNFNDPPGLSGWNNRVDVTGQINTTAGTPISINVSADLSALIDGPGKPYGWNATQDQSVGTFWGEIEFRLSGPYIPGSGNVLSNGQMLFSLDIGSDAELSDPTLENDEVFDPGDAYAMGGPLLPLGGTDGLIDDTFWFVSDPNPNTPDGPPASTGAPTGSNFNPLTVQTQYFDMDGLDNLDTDFRTLIYGPGNASIAPFPDACIHDTRFVFLSFDDDDSLHYVSPPLAESVPVNSLSPLGASIFGTTGGKDEVIEVDFSATVPAIQLFSFPIYDESMVHPNMIPNPDAANQLDDDVDALDFTPSPTACPYIYFSVDHEATYIDPNIGNPLDPGSVYMALSGGVLEIVNPVTHLGLLPGVDVDAFEFVWLYDVGPNRMGLALLFSVDDNDPLTPADESGTLDPATLYYSFLNGWSAPFCLTPMADDVDGISTWTNSLNGTSSGGTTGYLNAVPQTAALTVYPNPFQSATEISYFINQTSRVVIEIFDATGAKVSEPVNGLKPAGSWKTNWNGYGNTGEKLAAGIYLCRMTYTENGIDKAISQRIVISR